MTTVYLDTVGIIAMLNADDQWHSAALAAAQRVHSAGNRAVTSPHVLWECGNAAARRPYRHEVAELRAMLKQQGRLLEVTGADEEAAWASYQAGSAGEAGIVDLISMAVMRRLGIRQVFTNDKHFAAAGFEVLF